MAENTRDSKVVVDSARCGVPGRARGDAKATKCNNINTTVEKKSKKKIYIGTYTVREAKRVFGNIKVEPHAYIILLCRYDESYGYKK